MVWQYNTKAHRYQDAESKRFLSASSSLELRDHYLDLQRERMADLTQRVSSGDLTIGQWETSMRNVIKQSFTTSYMYGRGGRQAMSAEDMTRLSDMVSGQWRYLNGFARDLETGVMPDLQVQARAALYANAAVLANEQGKAASYVGQDPSAVEEFNHLGSSDSCRQCPDLTALRWVAFGTLPLPGSRLCKAACKCWVERRPKVAVTQESQRLWVVA